ncbi:MAG: hypothetical protein CL913_03640 [Deltaproteobacteria bacterium]|nr:hypothetical protein [Deltaproteobacteria bacterium]
MLTIVIPKNLLILGEFGKQLMYPPTEELITFDYPIRTTINMLLSAHRIRTLTYALQQIGKLVLENVDLIRKGLPPISCKRAQFETVT